MSNGDNNRPFCLGLLGADSLEALDPIREHLVPFATRFLSQERAVAMFSHYSRVSGRGVGSAMASHSGVLPSWRTGGRALAEGGSARL